MKSSKIEVFLNKRWKVEWYEPYEKTLSLFRFWYYSAPGWYRWIRREKMMIKNGRWFFRMKSSSFASLNRALKHYKYLT